MYWEKPCQNTPKEPKIRRWNKQPIGELIINVFKAEKIQKIHKHQTENKPTTPTTNPNRNRRRVKGFYLLVRPGA